MTDTLEPTVERLRHTFHAVAEQVVDAPPAFHAVPVAVAPLENKSADAVVVDIEAARPDRTAHRRWRVVAAAVAAVLLVAGVVLVRSADEGGIGTKPAGTSPSFPPVPAPSPTMVTPPSTVPGDGSNTGPLLPEGAPSSPHTGELVASASVIHNGVFYLFADGRLIGLPHDTNTEWVEQRLTPEGVERVRSEFYASGLFDPAQLPDEVTSCPIFQTCLRDGDRILTQPSTVEAARLLDYLRALPSTLPPTEWADQQPRTYVPSRIKVCMRRYGNRFETPLDLGAVLPLLPARAAELFNGREATGGISDDDTSTCFEMTLEEARTLSDELLAPSGGGSHIYWGINLVLNPQFDAAQPDARDAIHIRFHELLPDGVPKLFPG